MRTKSELLPRRRGAIAPLMAVLVIPIIGMVAFSVDIGYLIQVKSDLQNIADSAALAGSSQLADPYARWLPASSAKSSIRSAAITAAKTAAKNVAAANKAGGVNITLLDEDIQVGYMDAAGNFDPNPPESKFPNTVRLTARRDTSANTEVPMFFAPVIGTKTLPVTTGSRATIYTGVINSFQNQNIHILPMTYDVNHWDTFVLTGEDPDKRKSYDFNGDPVIKVYPSIKFSGNFGELSLDDEHTGSSEIRSWIRTGLPANSVQTLIDRNLLPLSSHPANTWDWIGNPGFKSSTVQEVNGFVGQTYYLPLFKAKDSTQNNYQAGEGRGESYFYNIVRFVPITLTDPTRENRDITLKPSGYIDPGAIFDISTITPAGTSSQTTITSFTTPRLSQ